jgi:hypothetical protein
MRRLGFVLIGVAAAGAVAGGYNLWQAGRALGEMSVHLGAASDRRPVAASETVAATEPRGASRQVTDERRPPLSDASADASVDAFVAESNLPANQPAARGDGLSRLLIEDAEFRAVLEELLRDPDADVRREAAALVDLWLPE